MAKTKTSKKRRTPVAIVTGGAGFIGSHVVDELVKRRYKVFVIDNLSTGRKENVNPNVKLFKMSVTSPKVKELFIKAKPDYVFHFAAQISVRKSIDFPLRDARTNVLGTINVLEAAKEVGVKKVVVASSGGIMYPSHVKRAKETDEICPESPYGVSKRAKELYLEHYYRVFDLPYVALRFANVYGPRQVPKGGIEGGVAAIFTKNLLEGKPTYITGSGKQTRDMIYVGDVVKASLAAAKKSFVGIINISSGKETSIKNLHKTAAKVIGTKQKPEHLPAISGEKEGSCLSPRKATKELGWKPSTSLEDGLKKTVRFMKQELKT